MEVNTFYSYITCKEAERLLGTDDYMNRPPTMTKVEVLFLLHPVLQVQQDLCLLSLFVIRVLSTL